jgi:uncharacterized protein (TIGR02217 family)
MPNGFHEVRFPLAVALGGSGGPERKTEIVTTGSGREERIARWVHAKRKYDAGTGVKTIAALAEIVTFFEERRGRLFGFRWRDRLDWKSCTVTAQVSANDQVIGTGNGTKAAFQLVKTYGGAFAPYVRPITKPVSGTVKFAVAGIAKVLGVDADVDVATGILTFKPGKIPANGAVVTAGFEFDVPVRFDTDVFEVDFAAFVAGEIPKIPLVEIVP